MSFNASKPGAMDWSRNTSCSLYRSIRLRLVDSNDETCPSSDWQNSGTSPGALISLAQHSKPVSHSSMVRAHNSIAMLGGIGVAACSFSRSAFWASKIWTSRLIEPSMSQLEESWKGCSSWQPNTARRKINPDVNRASVKERAFTKRI